MSDAVRELRQALGETQEKFAQRMQTTIRTIARYERDAPPAGLVLARLEQIAGAHNLPSLAKTFHDAVTQELGEDHIQSLGNFYSITLSKAQEVEAVRALVEALRNPRYREIAAHAVEALGPVIDQVRLSIDQNRRALRLADAMLTAYREGKTARQIATFFQIPLESVHEWMRTSGLPEDAKLTQTKRKNNAK